MQEITSPRYFKNDGYWNFKYRIKDIDNKWHDKTCRGKKRGWTQKCMAKSYYDKIIRGEIKDATALMFSDVARHFIQEQSKTLKLETIKSKSSIVSGIINLTGDFDMRKIVANHISNHYDKISDNCSTGGSIAKYKNLYAQIFEFAEVFYNLEHLPVRIVKTKKKQQKKDITEANLWSSEEMDSLLNLVSTDIKSQPKKEKKLEVFKLGIFLQFNTGVRIGEARTIKVSDIKVDKENDVYIDVKGTKTINSERRVYLTTMVFEEIAKHAIFLQSLEGYDDAFELLSTNGKGYAHTWWNKFFKYYCAKMGKTSTLHKLRHSHASELYNNSENIDTQLIAERLGHKDDKTTKNTYIHIAKTKQKEILGELKKVELGSIWGQF